MSHETEMPDLSASSAAAANPGKDPKMVNASPAAESKAGDPAPQVPAVAQGESWLETVKTIFYALLIALVIRTLFFQPFNIPSASMEDTLLVGDYLFVEKFAYGYSRYTFPFGGWPFGDSLHGRFMGSTP